MWQIGHHSGTWGLAYSVLRWHGGLRNTGKQVGAVMDHVWQSIQTMARGETSGPPALFGSSGHTPIVKLASLSPPNNALRWLWMAMAVLGLNAVGNATLVNKTAGRPTLPEASPPLAMAGTPWPPTIYRRVVG
jgi:hypothetical protein